MTDPNRIAWKGRKYKPLPAIGNGGQASGQPRPPPPRPDGKRNSRPRVSPYHVHIKKVIPPIGQVPDDRPRESREDVDSEAEGARLEDVQSKNSSSFQQGSVGSEVPYLQQTPREDSSEARTSDNEERGRPRAAKPPSTRKSRQHQRSENRSAGPQARKRKSFDENKVVLTKQRNVPEENVAQPMSREENEDSIQEEINDIVEDPSGDEDSCSSTSNVQMHDVGVQAFENTCSMYGIDELQGAFEVRISTLVNCFFQDLRAAMDTNQSSCEQELEALIDARNKDHVQSGNRKVRDIGVGCNFLSNDEKEEIHKAVMSELLTALQLLPRADIALFERAKIHLFNLIHKSIHQWQKDIRELLQPKRDSVGSSLGTDDSFSSLGTPGDTPRDDRSELNPEGRKVKSTTKSLISYLKDSEESEPELPFDTEFVSVSCDDVSLMDENESETSSTMAAVLKAPRGVKPLPRYRYLTYHDLEVENTEEELRLSLPSVSDEEIRALSPPSGRESAEETEDKDHVQENVSENIARNDNEKDKSSNSTESFREENHQAQSHEESRMASANLSTMTIVGTFDSVSVTTPVKDDGRGTYIISDGRETYTVIDGRGTYTVNSRKREVRRIIRRRRLKKSKIPWHFRATKFQRRRRPHDGLKASKCSDCNRAKEPTARKERTTMEKDQLLVHKKGMSFICLCRKCLRHHDSFEFILKNIKKVKDRPAFVKNRVNDHELIEIQGKIQGIDYGMPQPRKEVDRNPNIPEIPEFGTKDMKVLMKEDFRKRGQEAIKSTIKGSSASSTVFTDRAHSEISISSSKGKDVFDEKNDESVSDCSSKCEHKNMPLGELLGTIIIDPLAEGKALDWEALKEMTNVTSERHMELIKKRAAEKARDCDLQEVSIVDIVDNLRMVNNWVTNTVKNEENGVNPIIHNSYTYGELHANRHVDIRDSRKCVSYGEVFQDRKTLPEVSRIGLNVNGSKQSPIRRRNAINAYQNNGIDNVVCYTGECVSPDIMSLPMLRCESEQTRSKASTSLEKLRKSQTILPSLPNAAPKKKKTSMAKPALRDDAAERKRILNSRDSVEEEITRLPEAGQDNVSFHYSKRVNGILRTKYLEEQMEITQKRIQQLRKELGEGSGSKQ